MKNFEVKDDGLGRVNIGVGMERKNLVMLNTGKNGRSLFGIKRKILSWVKNVYKKLLD